MWHTPNGERTLTEAEWALFRVGVERLFDFISDEDTPLGLSGTDVQVFDELQPEQRLALLADVAGALRDPAVPPPRLTAANEATVAAVFASIRQALEMEIALADSPRTASREIRSLLLAAARDAEEQIDYLPALTDPEFEVWD